MQSGKAPPVLMPKAVASAILSSGVRFEWEMPEASSAANSSIERAMRASGLSQSRLSNPVSSAMYGMSDRESRLGFGLVPRYSRGCAVRGRLWGCFMCESLEKVGRGRGGVDGSGTPAGTPGRVVSGVDCTHCV